MTNRKTINVPLNRVEGDLEIRVELENGTVTDAWSTGTMFRGFEKLMVGRGALDGLVITPRICGICGTAHLTAAARALDMISGTTVPSNAVRLRNLALTIEHLQSDMRHGFLMFAADFVNPAYSEMELFTEAERRYKPFSGDTVVEVVRETKKILEIVAILGGQWPHSSYMIPGGVVSNPSKSDLIQCELLLDRFRNWYERRVIGCPIERITEISDAADLDSWLAEADAHKDSDLGFFLRYARELELNRIGAGPGNFLSYGSLDIPTDTQYSSTRTDSQFIAPGFVHGDGEDGFDQSGIEEHVAHSWYKDYPDGLHPFEGKTEPEFSNGNEKKYSWAKAPRYKGLPAETGPLAEAVVGKNPLFKSLIDSEGSSVFSRELARLLRPAGLIPAMQCWLAEMEVGSPFLTRVDEMPDGEGIGLIQASRGALGHWVKIRDGVIDHYQIITPTSWHASPRDNNGVRGTWEEALVGTRIKDPSNPVELGHVVRSFDACLVCTVHTVHNGRDSSRFPIGTI